MRTNIVLDDKPQRYEVFTMSGVDLAIAAAENRLLLRSRRHTVRRTIDCIIATYCIRHRFANLHADRDCTPFERLLWLRVVVAASDSPAQPL